MKDAETVTLEDSAVIDSVIGDLLRTKAPSPTEGERT